MKRFLAISLVLTVGVVFISCAKKITKMDGREYVTGRWVDDNTFRISGRCAYPKDETNQIVKEESASKCAQMYAKYQVLEKFAGSKFQGAAGMSNFRLTGIAAAEEVAGTIEGGSTIQTICNDKLQGCQVIYEVNSPGLKKKVTQIKSALNK